MKVSELIAKAIPELVPRARNLEYVGWADGYMVVKFRSSDALWIYGPQIPEVERDKLLRVPYPDKLFATNIKAKFQAHKAA